MDTSHKLSRRDFLKASAGAAGTLMALSLAQARAMRAVRQREPMHTEVRDIDGTPVVFQYGQPVPSFDTWREREPCREYIDLNGLWKFRFDPADEGLSKGWHTPGHDDSGWHRVQVPLPWDLYDTPNFGSYDGSRYGTGTAFYDGYAWYRKQVHIPANWSNKIVRLFFLGANYRTWVYINGQLVGVHEGGHTPFALDITTHILKGENTIAVRVYRRPWWSSYDPSVPNPTPITDDRELPYKPVDYWPYAGLTRDVYIEATSQINIVKLLTATSASTLDLRVIVQNNSHKHLTRTLSVDPGEGTGAAPQSRVIQLSPNQVTAVQFTFELPSATPWDTAHPILYRLVATLYPGRGDRGVGDRRPPEDSLSVRYGVRSVEVRNGRLLLNGRPIFLKGVNWHEETAERGRSLTLEEYDRELGLVLDAHANFIRNCVYNRHPYVYEFADTHGLLVLDDIDNMWLDTAQEALQTQSYGLSRALALMMAWNQANHPSVIMWCLQNESQIWADTQVYREWIRDMKEAVQGIDLQHRPVTWASSSSWDPAFDLADVIGFNEYFGYFYGQDSDLGPVLDAVHASHPDKPILITENGTWSIYGDHGSAEQPGTEEWHAAKFLAHWQQVTDPSRLGFIAGYTFWLLKDYKERMTYNRNLNGISTMGLVTFDTEAHRLVYNEFKGAANPLP